MSAKNISTRPPARRMLNRAITNYLAHRPEGKPQLELLLERIGAHEGLLSSVRGLKTSLLFTDIAGSTTMFERNGDVYGRRIISVHDRIVAKQVRDCGGSLTKHTGDGVLAAFASCGRAVKAAIRIQRQIQRFREEYPLLAFNVRIGVNIGAVVRSGADVYGASVNLAARLRDCARKDEILTTGIVYERCSGKGYSFVRRGKRRFRGIQRSIPVYEVRW